MCKPLITANPIVETAGSYSLLYDQGGTAYRLDTEKKNVYSDKSDNQLLCAGASESGSVVLCTTSDSAKSNVSVYNKSLKKKMSYDVANGYVIGGEQSGHIIFKEHAVTGDGILTSLMIMEAWLHYGKPMSMLTGDLVIYPQLLENVKVKDKVAAREDEDVQKAAKEVTESLGDAGRLLLRESGTEPLIRVMVEAETDEMCRKNVDKIVKVLHEKGHVPD